MQHPNPLKFKSQAMKRLLGVFILGCLAISLSSCGGKKSSTDVSSRHQLGATPHSYSYNCTTCGNYTAKITSGFATYRSQLGDFDIGLTLYAPSQNAMNVGSYQGPVVLAGRVRIRSLNGCYLPPGEYEIATSQVSGQFGWQQPFHLREGQAVLQSRTTNQAYSVPFRIEYIDFKIGQSFRWEADGLIYDSRFWGQVHFCNSLPVFIGS